MFRTELSRLRFSKQSTVKRYLPSDTGKGSVRFAIGWSETIVCTEVAVLAMEDGTGVRRRRNARRT